MTSASSPKDTYSILVSTPKTPDMEQEHPRLQLEALQARETMTITVSWRTAQRLRETQTIAIRDLKRPEGIRLDPKVVHLSQPKPDPGQSST